MECKGDGEKKGNKMEEDKTKTEGDREKEGNKMEEDKTKPTVSKNDSLQELKIALTPVKESIKKRCTQKGQKRKEAIESIMKAPIENKEKVEKVLTFTSTLPRLNPLTTSPPCDKRLLEFQKFIKKKNKTSEIKTTLCTINKEFFHTIYTLDAWLEYQVSNYVLVYRLRTDITI